MHKDSYILKNSKVIEVESEYIIPNLTRMRKRTFINFLNNGGGFHGWTPQFFLRTFSIK